MRTLNPANEESIMEVTEQRKVVQLSSPKTSSFSVSTYNILADCNMESDWYAIHTVLNTSQLIMKCEIDLRGIEKHLCI